MGRHTPTSNSASRKRHAAGLVVAMVALVVAATVPAQNARAQQAPGISVPSEGKVFDPPIKRSDVPDGAWYCDMGTVHYAAQRKNDGICPVCKMALVEKYAAADYGDTLSAPVELMKPKKQSSRMRWKREVGNTADLEDRCTAERLSRYKELALDLEKGPNTPISEFATQILDFPRMIRPEPWWVIYDMREMNYHKNRAKVQAEFEKQIAAVGEEKKLRYLDNYAWFLAYMGEFKKILDFFPERAKPYASGKSLEYGSMQFAISISNLRLGNYRDAVDTAKIAVGLVHDSPNDTRWQLMFSELNLYGADFFEKYSKDVYTTKNIPEWFPKAEWELPFEDATLTVGKKISRWGAQGAVNFVDFDGDGWDDIMLERKFFPPAIYRNAKGKSFEPAASDDLGGCSGILSPVADLDNDGHLDMFRSCCNYDGHGPLSFLRGKGNFQFEDISRKAVGDEEEMCASQGTWVDWDLDGDVDLFATNFCGPSRAYRNDGDGTFTDVTDAIGFKTPGDMSAFLPPEKKLNFGAIGSTAGYFFGSGYPDVFVQGWGWRQFYKNKGDGTFEEVREKTGLPLGEGRKNYFTFVFDYNNDGHEDIMSGSYTVGAGEQRGFAYRCLCSNVLRPSGFSQPELDGAPTIFENQGDGTFKDIRERTRFVPLGAMAYSHADWNNDGFEDLVFGLGGPFLQQSEPFLFYQNDGDGTFTQMTPFTLLSLWGKGHGVAFGDYDHDGHVDLMMNNGGGMPADNWPSMLLHNTGSDNHWVVVGLEADPATGTNAAAIGARIWVKAGSLKRVKTLFGGEFATNSFQTHFGLGKADKIDEIVVEWPNKQHTKTVLKDLDVDQAIVVKQADNTYAELWDAAPPGGNARELADTKR